MIAQTFPRKLLTFCTHWCSPYQGYHKSEVNSQQYSLHDVIIEGVFWSFQKPLWNIWSAVCSLDDIRYVMTHPRNLEIAALSGKPNCKGLNLMSVKIFSVLSHLRVQDKNKDKRILVDACELSCFVEYFSRWGWIDLTATLICAPFWLPYHNSFMFQSRLSRWPGYEASLG